MIDTQTKHIRETEIKLNLAINHLEYSYKKIQKLSTNVSQLDDEALETWESFAARFSRVVDIFLMRYLRAKILYDDPGFSGSFRDFLNRGEKLGILENTDDWLKMRSMRNVIVHDYSDEDLTQFFEQLKTLCPKLLALKKLMRTNAPE